MPRETPLFTGLTRAPEFAGMPVAFVGVAAVIPIVTFIMTQTFWDFWGLLTAIPSYLICVALSRRDPHIASIFLVSQMKTGARKSRAFWGGNSYGA